MAETLAPAELKTAIDTRFEWLLATAILAGALLRLNFGIWADKYGGRNMMVLLLVLCAVPTYLVSQVSNYAELLLCAAGFGIAGNAFTVGISWNSAWYPTRSKGFALGFFGAGNVGASGTKLLVILIPGVLTMVPAAGYLGGLIPGGWRFVPVMYSALLLLTALAILLLCPKVDHMPGKGRPLAVMLAPLRHTRVWRFSLYYVVVFGAYVALSAWLPNYYQTKYGQDLHAAALLTALYIFPASLLRPVGGLLSDRFGPRVVTYAVFLVMIAALVPLCLPNSVLDLGVAGFTCLMVVIGVGMGIGKASVFKYVPNYFPNDVGAVGGLVGALGRPGRLLPAAGVRRAGPLDRQPAVRLHGAAGADGGLPRLAARHGGPHPPRRQHGGRAVRPGAGIDGDGRGGVFVKIRSGLGHTRDACGPTRYDMLKSASKDLAGASGSRGRAAGPWLVRRAIGL